MQPGSSATLYRRHEPERTTLYGIVERHLPGLFGQLGSDDSSLPGFVLRELDDRTIRSSNLSRICIDRRNSISAVFLLVSTRTSWMSLPRYGLSASWTRNKPSESPAESLETLQAIRTLKQSTNPPPAGNTENNLLSSLF